MLFLGALSFLMTSVLANQFVFDANESRPIASMASGVVVGTRTTLPSAAVPVNKFLGVPFAQSPPERFAPPEDAASWSEPLDASSWKPACIQQFKYPKSSHDFAKSAFNNPYGPPPEESEDCLYLNVYAPASPAPSSGRAVMVWIYGGNLQFGTGGIEVYDGSSLAANGDVIVVTFNYRTNVFGFSNSPEIDANAQNVGFMDQRKALDWVQQNIAAFGGDKTKVTIFGESAGGYSVKQLLAAPPSPLTFRAAIMQSEGSLLPGNGSESWALVVSELGCAEADSQIECVRSKPATDIQHIIDVNMLDFAPTFDGTTAVADVQEAFEGGSAAPVPFVIGTTADEGRIVAMMSGIGPGSPPAAAQMFLDATFPGMQELHKAIMEAYPEHITSSSYLLVAQVITEWLFHCPEALLSDVANESGHEVWRYLFNASFPNTQPYPEAGAYHSSELTVLFGTYPEKDRTEQQDKLSAYMQEAWAAFAKEPFSGPGWTRFGSDEEGVDLGYLGEGELFGVRPIASAPMDKICKVYKSITRA